LTSPMIATKAAMYDPVLAISTPHVREKHGTAACVEIRARASCRACGSALVGSSYMGSHTRASIGP
ncbi:MAG: hypothetical protein WBG86_21155, partial [Polyangiales bacterium]